MSGMLENVNDFIQSTVGNMPLALLTIILLAAPTGLYLLYRMTVPVASHGRARRSVVATAQWVCPSCRSVNDLISGRCYRCGYDVNDAQDILVIDSVTAKPITLPAPEPPAVAPGILTTPALRPSTGVAVGPGRSTTPAIALPPGTPVGSPVPLVAGSRSAGTAVGARRPFDPAPESPGSATAVPVAVTSPSGAPSDPVIRPDDDG
jgi:hypothetical protein